MLKLRNILLLSLLCVLVVPIQAQKRREIKPLVAPAYRGLSVGFDVASPFIALGVDKSVIDLQATVDVNLYNRFFPVVEVGYGSIDQTITNGATYHGKAPFLSLGMNFNITGIPDVNGEPYRMRHYAYLGLRYGMSFLNYELENVPYYDPFWMEPGTCDFKSSGSYNGWAALVAGIKFDIVSGFTMGWAVSYKGLLHTSAPSKNYVWYVPGYGKSASSNFAFSYTLGYTFYYNSKTIKSKIVEP